MEGGLTRPLLMAAMNESGRESLVVVKLRHPDHPGGHYEGTSLACELIVSMLARSVGLPVPDYAVVDLPREILPAISDRQLRDLMGRNIGPNFGCVYHEGMALWDPGLRPKSPEMVDALADVLTLDATVINGDRKGARPNLLYRGESILLIDHSLALPVHEWNAEAIAYSPVFPAEQVRAHCTFGALAGRTRSFDKLHGRWQTEVSAMDLDRIRTSIPTEWERRSGDLERIFSFLAQRPQRFSDIAADLRRIVG